MADARANLRLIDAETGEIVSTGCPGCRERDDQLEGKERDLRAWRARYAALKREVNAEHERHDLFPAAKRLFDYWRERCHHPRSKFTPERFEQILPHLRDEGEEMCRQAIDGAAYEPYVTRRKNGSVAKHNGWGLIFRNREKLEEFANRAPVHLPSPEAVKIVAEAILFLHPDWELYRAVVEAQARLRRLGR